MIFNQEKVDFTKQPMFFGEPLNVARFDHCKYKKEIDEELTDKQLSFFWRPEEVDINNDRIDFNQKLGEHEKHIFTSNLRYQTLLDSIQARGLGDALSKIVSLPELENWVITWPFSETIHSRSYTHVIRNLYPDPGVIFDGILDVPEIISRATMLTDRYDYFSRQASLFALAGFGHHTLNGSTVDCTEELMMENLYLLLADVNNLEALRFFVSFACSFAFGQRGIMEGNAKIIKLICRDEVLHKLGTQWMINTLRSGKEGPLWAKIARKMDKQIPEMVRNTVESEILWARFLFKDGSMPGLNMQVLEQYMKYLANVNLIALGLAPIYPEVKMNPIPWIDGWTGSSKVQVAPQETEIISYLTAGLDTTTKLDLSGFSL